MGNKFRLRETLPPWVHLSRNWLCRVGIVIVLTVVVYWLYMFPMYVRAAITNPYMGIQMYLIGPSVFFAGLALILAGIAFQRRHERKAGTYPTSFVPLDFSNVEFRRLLLFVGIVVTASAIISGQLAFTSVSYMDTVSFCGQTCHTVMKPEYVAYVHSPHARVACVRCHIGPGASWFVRYKLSGTHQVFATLFNTYPRPIPVPVTNLRPAQATCEQCHWPARFEGNRLVVIPHYADDEKNSLAETVLLMHIGGGNGQGGIHGAHVGPGITIRYGSDSSRQEMHWVEYSNARTGKKALFVDQNTNPKTINPETGRVMDCIDCHNQPTHIFHLPGEAINAAITRGDIPVSLPYVKREGLALLQAQYSSQSEAAQKISTGLRRFYSQKYPQVFAQHQAEVLQAVNRLIAIYDQNVFPAMHVTWRTYPNNLGHMNFPGCFRCHGTLHETSDPGILVPQDCSTCHSILAMREAKPKILTELGLSSVSQGPQK